MYHTIICTSFLNEFAILHSQTSWIIQVVSYKSFKAGLTLNDLYDAACLTHNWLLNFYGIYTIIQVVYTQFIKVVLTDHSAFRGSSKMI